MRTLTQVIAKPYSTFRFNQQLSTIVELSSLKDLEEYRPSIIPVILGEGSNTVFLEDLTAPVCRYIASEKILYPLDSNYCLLHVEAGHNWHSLVGWTVNAGWWGIENLALIPGSVGAAPVQNIGAYGVELADRCIYVDFFHWKSNTVERINATRCQFGYRDSIFKHQLAGKGIIVAIGLLLQRTAAPVLNYAGLDDLCQDAPLTVIYDRVINVRSAKLPDPVILANCGSFFKNPTISTEHYAELKQHFPALPGYVTTEGTMKVPAAWLIDQKGFKGQQIGDVGCYEKQPLVLVNYGEGTAEQLLMLVNAIISAVTESFNIILQPEVRLLHADGSLHFD